MAELTCYSWQTPNGVKVTAFLEELGVKYDLKAIDISTNVQKEPEFLKINPNGRIPAIEDNSTTPPTRVFESGAILLYLAHKYDKENKFSFPEFSPQYWETVEWLFFQNSGVGPMQGQAAHFMMASEKIQYGIDRYLNETRRLYGILDKRLEETGDYLVKGKLTIADFSTVGWVNVATMMSINLATDFPHLNSWLLERLKARPALKRGLEMPEKIKK